MKAVNLIPAETRRRGSGSSTGMQVPVFVLLGLLAAALVLVTIYVLTTNTIGDRNAQLSSLRTQVAQQQALAARLGDFSKFSQLAQTRVQTVKEIAAARFDWHGALADLSKVVPANTSLQSLVGTVVPGSSAGGSGAGSAGGLRSGVQGPAFELTGCTSTQNDVARLMSQLRLMNGVTRVTLSNSTKAANGQGGAAVAPAAGSSGSAQGCGANAPTFDLLVFFQPVPGAGASGVTTLGGSTTAIGGIR